MVNRSKEIWGGFFNTITEKDQKKMKKGLIKYFAIFIYGMGMLIVLSKKEHSNYSTATNGHKAKTYSNTTDFTDVKHVSAQKFFSSNERFTLRFSDNDLSFLY